MKLSEYKFLLALCKMFYENWGKFYNIHKKICIIEMKEKLNEANKIDWWCF